MRFKRLVLTVAVFFTATVFFYARAQSAFTIFNSQNSQLPINTVRAIAIDSLNRKWVGTDYGLAVFDETNWTIYQTSNSGLPDNAIRSIAFDNNGAAWIGTINGGVAKFDGTNWTVYDQFNSPLPSQQINAVAFDSSNNKWIGTTSGLVKFDDTNWTVWDNTNSALVSNNIQTIAIGRNQLKYLGCINGGMAYFNDTVFTVYSAWNSQIPDNTVIHIALDSNDSRWVAMPTGGLCTHFGGSAWSYYSTFNSTIQSDALDGVFVDKQQNKYIASMQKGLIIFKNNNFVFYDSTNSDMPDTWVYCVIKDTNNIIWLGTYDGGLIKVSESVLNSIGNTQGDFFIDVFPNPATTSITILISDMNEEKKLALFDCSGRKITETYFTDSNYKLPLDVDVGIYFITITSGSRAYSRKITVVK
jgi:ligand-binding sensor domain-containing protein